MKNLRLLDLGLVGAILALACTVGYLGMQLRLTRTPAAPAAPLAVGTMLPALSAHSVDGTAARLEFAGDDRATVLYVFSPTCVWCQRNAANIEALVAADRSRFHWVALSTSDVGLAAYAKSNRLFDRILRDPAPGSVAAFRVGGTPDMLVIDRGGKLLAHWRGALASNQTRVEVEKFFGVALPPWPSSF